MHHKRYWLRGAITVTLVAILSLLLAQILLGVFLPIGGVSGFAGIRSLTLIPALPGILILSLTQFLNTMLALPRIIGTLLGLAIAFGLGVLLGHLYGRYKNS